MFSQVLVILSTGGGVPPSPRADIPPRQTPPGQTLPQATTTPPPPPWADTHPTGMHSCSNFCFRDLQHCIYLM